MSRATEIGRAGGLAAITAVSAQRNRADGLTGLLLYDGHRFLQAIEGDAPAVRACFARIQADGRHFDVRLAADETVDARQFGSWSMLSVSLEPAASTDFLREVAGHVAAVTDPHLKALFIGFASLRQRQS